MTNPNYYFTPALQGCYGFRVTMAVHLAETLELVDSLNKLSIWGGADKQFVENGVEFRSWEFRDNTDKIKRVLNQAGLR